MTKKSVIVVVKMMNKRQKLVHLSSTVLALALLSGCAMTQTTPKADQTGKSSQPDTPAVANSKMSGQKQANSDVAETNAAKDPIEKKLPVTRLLGPAEKSLSGEALYYLLSAEVAGQRGHIGASAALYYKAAEVTRDIRVAKRASRVAVYARDNELSLKAVTLWYSLEPTNIEARQVLAALLIREGKSTSAIEHLEYVLTHGTHTERQGYSLITSLLSKEKDKQVAIEVMKKLIAKRQKNVEALFAFSQLAFLVNELDEAAVTITKVINQQPDWTDAYILQSRILNRQGYKAHALKVLKQAVNEQSENNELRIYYARSLVDAKNYEAASEQFARLLESDSSHHEARFALGLLLLQMNKPLLAKVHFNALLHKDQKIAESRYYMGQLHETLNQLPEAISWYSKVRKDEYLFDAQLRIAFLQSKMGDVKEARNTLHNLSPENLEKELRLYLAEGEILNDAKMYEEAFNLYSGALGQLDGNTKLLYARALTAEKLDRIEFALNDLKSIVEREPANAQALNAYGYTLVDKTDRLDEGIGYIKKAIKLLPDDPAILDSLGWAYYRKGEHEIALDYLERAFDKLKDAEIAAHLGEVFWVLGEQERAREVWESALQQSPDDDLLLNVIRKYDQ